MLCMNSSSAYYPKGLQIPFGYDTLELPLTDSLYM